MEDLFFEARRSIRYHSKQADFFSFLNKIINEKELFEG
jgi:hypothetical protein